MIVVYQFLTAAAIIALLILIRVFANRAAVRRKLNSCDRKGGCHAP